MSPFLVEFFEMSHMTMGVVATSAPNSTSEAPVELVGTLCLAQGHFSRSDAFKHSFQSSVKD